MIDPALALTLFALLVVFSAALIWPRRGLIARLLRGKQATLRVEMEDALKHLYKSEYRGAEASVQSLAGALETTQARASELLSALQEAGLSQPVRATTLTEDGRAYALRIIRTHRLWERYLADRTGVAAGEWHREAEEQEHLLSQADVEVLSARLGHPRYDPHGDPIPTAAGDLPADVGAPLTHLRPGDHARITHLEDEPRELYDRLLELGLSPNMSLRVLEGPPGSVRVEADGQELLIDSGAAQNVTVQQVPAGSVSTSGQPTLRDLPSGEVGRVAGLSPACQGIQRRRLLDLGVVPGTSISAELTAAGGDPRAFMIRGALVALRGDQQAWVRMESPQQSEVA